MTVREWKNLVEKTKPDTPVIFYWNGGKPLPPDTYCDGKRVEKADMWDRGHRCPCLLVELGDAF